MKSAESIEVLYRLIRAPKKPCLQLSDLSRTSHAFAYGKRYRFFQGLLKTLSSEQENESKITIFHLVFEMRKIAAVTVLAYTLSPIGSYAEDSCSRYERDKAEYFSEKAGRQIVEKFGGGVTSESK